MAGIVLVFILLDKAGIRSILALALNLVDLFLSGGVWTPPYHRPLKFLFEFGVDLDKPFEARGGVNAPNAFWYFWMSLFLGG